MDIFQEVQKLDLPKGEYIVLGSGILGALGIREIGDIDLLVTEPVFETLRTDGWTYDEMEIDGRIREYLSRGNVEVYKDFWVEDIAIDTPEKIQELIQNAQVINSVPFIPLHTLRTYKEKMGREKDKKDIALIDQYLTQEKSE